jgi:uncharacterized repeat protein (TIGR01451 family)
MRRKTEDQKEPATCNEPERRPFSASLRRSKFVALLTGAFSSIILPGPAFTNPAPNPVAFSLTTPGAVSTTVPDGVCGLVGSVTGGGGASQGIDATLGGIGGGGARIGATFKVLPLQAVTGTVAAGGSISTTGQIGPPGGSGTSAGGAGGDINSATIHKGGSGGGSSSISVAGQLLIHAGGGGGGGAAHQVPPAGNGGAAGAAGITAGAVVAGANGSTGSQATGVVGGGQGGQTAAGGAGGVNSTTPARNGAAGIGPNPGTGGNGGTDNGTDSGGGGGGGYTGGGGGSATNGDARTGGGGGGGSSFLRATSPTVTASPPTGLSGTTVAGPAAGQTNGPAGAATLTWVPCLYTLSVAKSVATSPVNAGGRVVWTVSVTNTGPDPMTRGDLITLADTLPVGPNGAPTPQFRVLSIGNSGGTNADMASGTLTCTGLTVGAAMPSSTVCSRPYSAPSAPGTPTGGTRGLNSGETLTITYEQIISSTALCSTITNTATVSDRTTAGASTVRTANAPLTINCYDLAITKTATPTVQSAGDVITWTINVTNNGPAPMSGPEDTASNPLIVNDVAPVTNVGTPAAFTSSGPAGVCTYAAGVITCPGNLASGQTQTFTFQQTVNVAAPNGAVITNPANVVDYQPSDSNDSASAAVTVAAKPRLTLLKTVTNDNGGTNVDTDFTLTATGPSTITGVEGAVAITNAIVNPGTYVLTESGAATAAYTQGTWTCTAGTLTGNSLALIAGQTANCTITNNDKPRLTLLKTVINDNGGAALDTAFTLTATGPVTISGVEGGATITNAAVNAGTYALSESALAGYTGGAWSCVGGTLTGSNLTLAQNQNATCTITNDDVAPRLTLLKTVSNDNGGTNVDTDFTLTATGPTTITGVEGGAAVTNAAVTAGTYTLTESGAATANYTQGTWTCTAGTLTGNSLVLAVGQTASCTITNNDKPRLTLLKTVINDNGGTALDTAFTLTATGPVTISGVEGGATITNAAVNAGTYALSESALAGYTGGAWSCVGGTLSGSNLTLAQNQNATCTVSNNDQTARLTLTKTIVNTGGGTATLATFPLTAAGPVTISGTSGTAAVTNAAVNAGTYLLSEVTNSNYTASAWSCSAGTLTGNSLVLAPGQTASCAITNTFVPAPALTIDKTANTTGPVVAGQTVTYNYVVTNTGNVTITGVNVIETAFNGTGIAPVPTTGGSTTLLPGQSVSFSAPYLVTQQDVDTLQ